MCVCVCIYRGVKVKKFFKITYIPTCRLKFFRKYVYNVYIFMCIYVHMYTCIYAYSYICIYEIL